MSMNLDEFIESLLGGSGEHFPLAGPGGRRAVCFASGSNEPSEVRGFASVGIPPGMAADRLVRENGELAPSVREVFRFAGTGMPVFVDSGEFTANKLGHEITHEEWIERLALYKEMATVLGPQLYLVAPDRVGDQVVTLERLSRYVMEIRECAGLGAQILMPLQPGPMALDEFQQAAQEILGIPVVPSFPMRDGITPLSYVVEFVRAVAPEKIHLLGLGAANRLTQKILDALWEVKPDLHIQQDAMLLNSRMGTKENPRLFLKLHEESYAFCVCPFEDNSAWDKNWAYTDEVGDPTSWMGPAKRAQIARKNTYLTPEQVAAFTKDPTEFLQAEAEIGNDFHWDNECMGWDIDQAWAECIAERTATRRRAWAIQEAFKDHPAAGQFCGPADIKRELEIVSILEKMRVSIDGLEIQVSAESRDEHPRIFTGIHVRYLFRGRDLPLDKLERAVKLSEDTYCGVSAMLRPAVPITSEIVVEDPRDLT